MTPTSIYAGGASYFFVDGVPKQRGAYEILQVGELVGIRHLGAWAWIKGCELKDYRLYTDAFGNTLASPSLLVDYLASFIFLGQTTTLMTTWGSITGQITDQLDLVAALGGKVNVLAQEVRVTTLANLPAPVSGNITLAAGVSYNFYTVVDLAGNNLILNGAVLRGISQELSGVANGTVTVTGTSTVLYFRFQNIAMTINAPSGALDWSFVNFYDCPNAVNIVAAGNVVMQTFGFLNSANFRITGTLDSLVLSPNCIFRGVTNPTAVFLDFAPTAVVTRRVRIQDSVFATDFAGQTAVRVQAGASIGTESFIFKTVRYTGAGTFLSGINGDDDRSVFFEVVGGNAINSTAIANMYMNNNAIPTPIPMAGNYYAMVGTTLFGPIRQKFVHDPATNSLIYTSIVPRAFKVQVPHSVIAPNNNIIGVYIAVDRNGLPIDPVADRILESESYVTASGAARPEAGFCQAVVTLSQGDRVYLVVENSTAAQPVTVFFANIIIERSI